MPLIMNASSKEQTVQVHGAWFTFAPGAIKEMNENKVHFLSSNKGYMGFVQVPDELSDLDARSSADGKKKIEELREAGVRNRIQHLEWLKNNELKSLRQDMDKQNIKAETETEMTASSFKSLTSAMEELKGYRTKDDTTVQDRAKRLKELQAALSTNEE
jgi:transcription antitermination factor NusG